MRIRALTVFAAVSCLTLLAAAAVWADGNIPSKPDACECYGPAATRDGDGDGVPDRIDRCPNTPQGCMVDEWGCSIDNDGDGVCDGVDKCPNTPKGEKVDKNGCSQSQRTLNTQTPPPPPPAPEAKEVAPPPVEQPKTTPPVSEMERQLVEGGKIRLENVYFETNSANLLPESEATLNEAGHTLEKFQNLKIEVQGHTDTRGSAAYNQRLSQARAESVRKYLLDHFSLTPANYVAKGYGESQPETQERNDEELLRNRRVVLNVLNPQDLPRGVKVENKQ
jgi:OmpA-OmpF porin, OOP family